MFSLVSTILRKSTIYISSRLNLPKRDYLIISLPPQILDCSLLPKGCHTESLSSRGPLEFDVLCNFSFLPLTTQPSLLMCQPCFSSCFVPNVRNSMMFWREWRTCPLYCRTLIKPFINFSHFSVSN